jgi:hypothetical protein
VIRYALAFLFIGLIARKAIRKAAHGWPHYAVSRSAVVSNDTITSERTTLYPQPAYASVYADPARDNESEYDSESPRSTLHPRSTP